MSSAPHDQTAVDQSRDNGAEPDREVELLRSCQQGDQQAYTELVEKYRERAFWVAYQMVGDMHEARDLSQEAFLRVYRSIQSFELGKNFFTWLYRIVTNLAIDHLRKMANRQAVPLDALVEIQGGQAAADVLLSAQELSSDVRGTLEQLPEKYRQVIVLRDLHDMSCKEIGHIVGAKHATVRWQLHQARKLFREAWEKTVAVEPDGKDEL